MGKRFLLLSSSLVLLGCQQCLRTMQELCCHRTIFIWVSKSNWFCVYYAARLVQKTRATFHPIRSKTKTNRDSLVRVFPRFVSATCNYFVFWLVNLIICVFCDWLEWLLWFWFYDTQLKSALYPKQCQDYAPVQSDACHGTTDKSVRKLSGIKFLKNLLVTVFRFDLGIQNFLIAYTRQ